MRYQYYQQMDKIIVEEAPIVPLYYDKVIRLIQNNINGLSKNPMNLLTLKRVQKELPSIKANSLEPDSVQML